MIVTQTLATQAIQSATCCLAKIGKKISDLTRYGLDFNCEVSEYNLLKAYIKILSEYQWGPNCSCSIEGIWWAAGSYTGRMTFFGDGTVSWFINTELGFFGTYTFDEAGSMSVFIEAGEGTINLVVYPTNGESFFNDSCTIFDGTSYVYREEEATSANIEVPGKYINPFITVDGVTIYSFSGILDVNSGPIFLTNFVTAFNNYMSTINGEYQMLLVSPTEFQITGPPEVDGLDVAFRYGASSITSTFEGGVSPGFEETQLVLSNCANSEAIVNVTEDIDFDQDISISIYSLSASQEVVEIVVPGGAVTTLQELVDYLNNNLVPPFFTGFTLDGTTIIVSSEDPVYIANPVILNYFTAPSVVVASGTPGIAWNTDFILVIINGSSIYEKSPTGFATEAEFIADFNLNNSAGVVLTKEGSVLTFTSENFEFSDKTLDVLLNDSVYFSAAFEEGGQEEISLSSEIVCVDQNPPVDCPPIYNCLTKEDLGYIIKAINNICSIYKC